MLVYSTEYFKKVKMKVGSRKFVMKKFNVDCKDE